MRRKSKTPEAKRRQKLMELAKKYIKLRDGNTCFTCGALELEGSNFQAGHFIADSVGGVELRYDEFNLHPQCMRCNIFLSGNEGEYYIKMVKVYGQDKVDEMFKLKHKVSKWYAQDFKDKIEYYEEKLREYE